MALAVVALVCLAPTAAYATGPGPDVAPIDVDGRVTDQVDALDSAASEVTAHLDRLSQDTDINLYVVYVDDFSGMSGPEWADASRTASRLGPQDVLLAVAVTGGDVGLSVAGDSGLTDDQTTHIRDDLVEPRLAVGDWTGAAVAAADGLRAVATESPAVGASGAPPAAPTSVRSHGLDARAWVGAALVLVVVGLVARALVRTRRAARPGPG